jgi:hypothetical protein
LDHAFPAAVIPGKDEVIVMTAALHQLMNIGSLIVSDLHHEHPAGL